MKLNSHLVIAIFLISSSYSFVIKEKVGGILDELLDKINSYQVLKSQDYKPPFKWAEKLGLYRSDIRINLAGNPIESEIRNSDLTAIFDNDMFSTGWILTSLLESYLYGSGTPTLDSKRLELAINSIEDYHNKNENEAVDHIPIMTFWPQSYNSTYDIWQSQPINIRNILLNIEDLPWDLLEKLLDTLKLQKLAQYIQNLLKDLDSMIDVFRIPPDFDDTYLNLGLGATLYKLKDKYPNAFDIWNKNNTNIKVLIENTVKYAYRPFDSDINFNVIDPRTYFFAREFLLDAYAKGQSVSLITTWIQNIDEQRVLSIKGVSMPFNVNNVDVTVCANSIYGITSATLYDINGFQQEFLNSFQFQQLYLNTTKFISWAIQTNFTKRPDLAQVYYPSKYNFLWYASRTLFLLENELINVKDNKLKEIFQEARDYLQTAFENSVTLDLYDKAQYDKKNPNEAYFDDFLGLNDTNIIGQHSPTGEDRIFSTAQVINVIISTWTYQDSNTKKLIWKNNADSKIKSLLNSTVNWLQANVLNSKLKPLNAFFSGSVKGFSSLPFWYPGNFVQYLNGTLVPDPSKVPESDLGKLVYGVAGVVDEDSYQQMLREKHFGQDTPIDFHGYNVKDNFFPFWASQPYTYSVALLALTQYNNLVF